MTRLHAAYSGGPQFLHPHNVALHDIRAPADAPRLRWHRALLDVDGRLMLEADYDESPHDRRRLDVFKTSPRSRQSGFWVFPPAAFEPPEASRGHWNRLLVRDVRVALQSWRPCHPNVGDLDGLDIPTDVGSNGWVCTEFCGKRMLAPSLTLLASLAIPSYCTWERLRHPLSMDLVIRRQPENDTVVELRSAVASARAFKAQLADLCVLAFWMEGDARLRSLRRALQGFGQPNWSLVMPDRPEVIPFAFDGYERDDVIVVQRIRLCLSDRPFPMEWDQILFINGKGNLVKGAQLSEGLLSATGF